MADKWEPNQVFYDQLSKATLLKLLAEGCGNDAVENCQTMKRSDLAVTVNERLAGRRILPPPFDPLPCPMPPIAKAKRHDGTGSAPLPRSPQTWGGGSCRSPALRLANAPVEEENPDGCDEQHKIMQAAAKMSGQGRALSSLSAAT
jgi:hypothetical protein